MSITYYLTTKFYKYESFLFNIVELTNLSYIGAYLYDELVKVTNDYRIT